jgi:RHS repeat-associated protein
MLFKAKHKRGACACGGGLGEVPTSTQNSINSALDFPQNVVPKSSTNQGDAPKAFLNYMYFDRQMNFLTSGFQQISTAAQLNREYVELDLPVFGQDGYVMVYVSNESDVLNYVHFDDFTIYHGKTNVVSAQSYYPYGAPFNEFVRTASIAQPFKYQGKEWQTDNGLNIYDNEWRQYDPYIVRTTTQDPHAERYPSMSMYSWVFGNPMSVVDPDGRDGVLHLQVLTDENGNVSKEIMKAVWDAVSKLAQDFSDNGICASIKVTFSNEIMSKEDFENRDDYHKSDSYTLIGTSDQLKSAAETAGNLGWEKGMADGIESVSGTSGRNRDGFSIVNMDNVMKKDGSVRNAAHMESATLYFENFKSAGQKLFHVLRHETGHDKLKISEPKYGDPRHERDSKNMLFPYLDKDQTYNSIQIETLKRLHNTSLGPYPGE